MTETALMNLRALFNVAVDTADPVKAIPDHLPPRPKGRVVVVGAGKGSARMAEAVEQAWGPCEGLVITRYGHARPTRGIEIVEAAHPVPDAAGAEATERMINLVSGLGPQDFVLALISGGASALLCAPAEGMSLKEKQDVHRALLTSGAPIGQMNVLRKHLSRVKGGQLGAATYPARLLGLLISDVPGDDPSEIGSGACVGETSTPDDAATIALRYEIRLPASAQVALSASSRVIAPEDPRLSRSQNQVIAAPAQSLAAAGILAQTMGYDVRMLGDAIEGEARAEARRQVALALEISAGLRPGAAPVLLLSGGECTVTGVGGGVGGPNAEFALAAAIALDGCPEIHLIACDTDGIDGAAEVAGAAVGPDTLARARRAGVDAAKALAYNDAHSFFASIGDQIVTGPTLTNVNDFRAILIAPRGIPDA